MSRNFSTSANATISSNFRLISARRHAEDCAVEVNVLSPGQLGMESGADLEQARQPAEAHAAFVGSVIRLRIFSSVLLPAPLRPMMPTPRRA